MQKVLALRNLANRAGKGVSKALALVFNLLSPPEHAC